MKKTCCGRRKAKTAHEHLVVRRLVSMLRRQRYRVREEVPNMGQSADIVATKGRWLTFVEAKVSNWRRAIQQCRAHEHVADFICIAVASSFMSAEFLASAKDLGYGVIQCKGGTGQCRWVLRARRNKRTWRPQRRHFAKALRKIDYAN